MAPPKKQQTLSAFFTKPVTKTSTTPLADDNTRTTDWELPDSKRRKLGSTSDVGDNHARNARHKISPLEDAENVAPALDGEKQPQALPTRSSGPARAARYLFRPGEDGQAADVSNDTQDLDPVEKAELHRRFVKKLGKPDSIYDIKRRNKALFEEDGEQQDEEDDDENVQESVQTKGRSKTGKKPIKLTPMEKQVIEIKQAHKDTLLVVEVGYKFRFFGEDARVAAKELGIVCIPGKHRFDEHPSEAHLDRFASASIPVHRLHVHVKRLVQAGHKVGVVRQLETAALKAVGDNRNAPFVRKLTNLYTKGTYIDDTEDIDEAREKSTSSSTKSTGFLMCLTETNAKGYGNDDHVHVGLVAVQPATGDVIYDDFEDAFMRSETETRLLHIAPCELLIVGEVSSATEKLIKHLSGSKANVFGDRVRVERVAKDKTGAAQAHAYVTKFYADKMMADTQDAQETKLIEKVLGLPEHVMVCLAALMSHMSDYGLASVFDLTKYFQAFSARSYMLLNATTLNSLEIYRNQTDQTVQGSLFWALDRTRTKFGSRMLRKWIGRPLVDRESIAARLNAIEELLQENQGLHVEKLQKVLAAVKTDLEKSLLRIYYGKCTRPELLTVLQAFQHLVYQYPGLNAPIDTGFDTPLLAEAVLKLPTVQTEINEYLDRINLQAAKGNDKYDFFREEHQTDAIKSHNASIASVEADLDAFRAEAAQKLGVKKPVEYVTVAGIDYLIEVDNSSAQLKQVPASWQKISGTKKVSRFHPPDVVRLVRERDQYKESLAAACDAAFQDLLREISAKYAQFRDTVQALATLDCLMSLAHIARQPGYTRPHFSNSTEIQVKGARHPMVEQILLDAYVPNDISLRQASNRALLVTGPNMGGKSSYVRSVALIVIMAQIGCFVPADEALLGITDAIFTRMGAFDNMMAGESTFMVELSETSDILKIATSKSLVILDELGRGTSTHDGVAIAAAVLDWLVREKKCLTLFITHYQVLAHLEKSFSEQELQNVHMKFNEDETNSDNITFLYEVGPGIAHRSYGLNVARLAGLGKSLIDVARLKSSELEATMRQRNLKGIAGVLTLQANQNPDVTSLINAIEEL